MAQVIGANRPAEIRALRSTPPISADACVNNIAAYVAQATAAPGKDTGLLAEAVQAPGAGKPAVEANGKLQIDADPNGQLAFVTKQASGKTGSVQISMKNTSGVQHNIAIQLPLGSRRTCNRSRDSSSRIVYG